MICGSFSAFAASGLAGLRVSIGVFSCSVFRSDNSVSMVAGLVSRSKADLRIREYCWCYAATTNRKCDVFEWRGQLWCVIQQQVHVNIVCNTAANVRQYVVLSYIIYWRVSVTSVTIIRVLYRNTNKNTNTLFVFLYNTLIMVAEAIETCRWIIYDKTYFIDGQFLVYCIA